MRLKDICQLNPAYTGYPVAADVSFVPMESLRNGNIDLKDIAYSEAKGKYTYFANGDLLVAKVTPCFENGNIAIAENLKNGIGFGSSEIFVLRMNEKAINRYIFYLSQTTHFQNSACATMCGVGGLKRISPLFFRTYEVDIPSIEKQKRIVDYLDKKLSAIDRRVSVLEQQRDTYMRLKKSMIHQAVTRGLNPDVRLKDSGINWIGMIPNEWIICRFKNTYKKANVGESIDKEYNSENLDDRLFYTAGIKPIHTCYGGFPKWKLTNHEDLLLARNGTPYVYLPERDSIYSDHIIRVDIKKDYCKEYVRYCLQLAITNEIVDSVSIPTWSISIWEKQHIPLPSLTEQKAIASYLDDKCAKIDAAIENIEKQIAASKRLKKAIINEAISGKINFDNN